MKVYRDFDQAALNAEYSPSATVAPERLQGYLREYAALSAQAREQFPGRLGLSFGPSADETLDFLSAGPGSPLVVTIHGGYWRMLSKDDFMFPALALVPKGISVASLNYGLAPATPLSEIVRQCRAAVAWLHREAGALGFDRERIGVFGHSAGGHLGGMLVSGDWERGFGVPAGVVRRAVLVSGLYDLEPVRLSHVQEWIGLDEHKARALSPHHLQPASAQLFLSYGERDTAEFRRQTDDFGAAWRARGGTASHIPMPGTDHFDVVLGTTRADSPLIAPFLTLTPGQRKPGQSTFFRRSK